MTRAKFFFVVTNTKMPSTIPQKTYKNAMVLYHWNKCPHCVNFMPAWNRAVTQLENKGVKCVAIEVETHQTKLEQLGVDLDQGVPRVVMYDHNGRKTVYNGPRTTSGLMAAAQTNLHGGSVGDTSTYVSSVSGGGGGRGLKVVAPADISTTAPVLVLYARDTCPYCVQFKPTFATYANDPNAPVQAVTVDTAAHANALAMLHPEAASNGVPHVVFHDATGKQTPFTGERTVGALQSFAQRMVSGVRHVSFEGGSIRPVNGSADARLTTALDKLQARAATRLGRRFTTAFEPDHATVSLVASQPGNTVYADRVFILITPIKQPRGKPPIHASLFGARSGTLAVKIYEGRDMVAMINNKRHSGFTPVLETDPYVGALQAMGYYVGLTE